MQTEHPRSAEDTGNRAALEASLSECLQNLIDTTLPASAAQQRLWFLDQLQPGTSEYNIPGTVWITGKLDVPALEGAFRAIIDRHDSLRARFVAQDGEARQLIADTPALPLPRDDVSSLPLLDRELAARRWIEEQASRPFDLSSGGLIRAGLLHVREDEHVLSINMHHIISDEWSLKLFVRELQIFYADLANGRIPKLPEPPIQYSDFAAWQQDWLQTPEFKAQLAYWEKKLAGTPKGMKLPADFSPSGESAQGGIEFLKLPLHLTPDLKAFAARCKATLFIISLAACKVLFYRRTGQEDVVLGSPMAGRRHVETEEVIGLFANTLPLRTTLNGGMTFMDVVGHLRETAFGAYSNQDVPFERIVEALQPERSPGQTPFFNVLFLFQTDLEFLQLPGLQCTTLDTPSGAAKFDMTLVVADTHQGLVLAAEYKTALFKAETIRSFLRDLETLLCAILNNPARPISELPLAGFETREASSSLIEESSEDRPWDFLDPWFERRARRMRQDNSTPVAGTCLNEGAGK